MKSTIETLEPTKVRLTVTVDNDELKPHMDKAYKDIASQVSVPGFRKGHIPSQIIDQRFGRAAVIEQVVNDSLSDYYAQAVSDNDLRPMDRPEVEVTEIPNTSGPQGGQLIFTADVDIVPAFELPELDKDFLVEVEPATVSDDDVKAEVDRLRSRFASLKTVDRPAKDGDFVTIDLKADVNGEEVDSLSDVSYEVGSGKMLPGQDEALEGAQAGDDVTFTATLLGGDHKGKDANVSIHVDSVKEREMPEVDDDFAQMASEFDTADELMENMKEQAKLTKQSEQAASAKDRLVESLLEKVDILLPNAPVDNELENNVDADASDEEKAEARANIERSIREDILAEELSKKFSVAVSQRELIDYMMQLSQTYGVDVNQLMSEPSGMQTLVANLGRTKAVIEALRHISIKDTNGDDVDLSVFLTSDEDEASQGSVDLSDPSEELEFDIDDDSAEDDESIDIAQPDGKTK